MSCTSYARPDYGNAYASCAGRDLAAYGCCDDDSNSASSSCSSSSSSSSSSDGWPEDSGSVVSSSSSSSKGEKTRAVHGKWLKTLWTVIDRADPSAERKTRHAKRSPPPPPRHTVKNILRPPTEYVYVIGMSGLPSKVAVYPKRA